MRTIAAASTSYSFSPYSSPSISSHSSWHSPIPYLFGGLAAMLGLIAFALLILACSYWRLTGQLQDEENNNRNSEKEGDSLNEKSVKVYEEKFLVIMAGDQNPTFLATPVFPKSFSVMDLNSDEMLRNHEAVEKTETETEVSEERNQNQQQQ
ncbi:protein GLUTAMINE DUMPER 5-like [Vicia villosa]|uniref:protein GLUTAMINE DUMPER 5-like n=1 Tax=Vicia villosa TaxID=3911 RepID=UPI00273CC332|nr:protein GLUTAMINE DUMPER 5-like [Vicia villosa]